MNILKNKLSESLLYFLISIISVILLTIAGVSENEIFNTLGIIIFSLSLIISLSLSFLYFIEYFRKGKNIENVKVKQSTTNEEGTFFNKLRRTMYISDKKFGEFLINIGDLINGLLGLGFILVVIFIVGIIIFAIIK